jgi:quercetin dioxygenase-like cupin family protein
MMRLHIIAALGLLSSGALAQKPAAPASPASGDKTVKLKVPPLPPSTDDFLVGQLADAKWVPAEKLDAKLPAGAEIALIGADPTSTGPTVYLRMKPGYKLSQHWHTHAEQATMISGKGTYVVDGKKVPTGPGTFVNVPSKAKHEFSCDAGAECIFVVHRSGPTDYNWVAGK